MASHDGPHSFARDHISYLIATLRPRRDFGVEFLKETASTDVQERIARTGVDVGRDAGNRHHEQSGHGSKGRKRTHGRERVKRQDSVSTSGMKMRMWIKVVCSILSGGISSHKIFFFSLAT